MRIFHIILTLCVLMLVTSMPVEGIETEVTDSSVDIFALISQAGSHFEDAPMVTVFDRINTEYKDTGAAITEEEVLLHFRDSENASAYRSLHYEYNPRTANIEFLSVKIYRADGSTIDEIPIENVVIDKAPADSIFWNFDIVICPVPLLEDGDALYYKIRRQGLNLAYLDDQEPQNIFRFVPPHSGFFMDTLFFQEKHPIIEKNYSITGPRSKPLQFAMANGRLDVSVRFDEVNWFYSFSVNDIDSWVEEPFDDGYEETALKLALASHPSWEMKSKWAFEHNEPQFIISESLKQKSLEIVSGCKDDDCKMFRLLHWVAEEIRYLGLDMGEGEGHMVHPTDEIFRDRAGVCKDKAAVLVSMLRAAGFDSYFVMTLAMERTLDIPADDKFNHGVVAVRHRDGTWTFLDPTWAPQNRPLFNYLEQEQPILIAAPEGQPLRHVPYSPPSDSPMIVDADTSLNLDGSALIELSIRTDGYIDAEFRRQLSWMDPQMRDNSFHFFIEQLSPTTELLSYSFTDPMDIETPISMKMRAIVHDAATRVGDILYFNPVLTRHFWNRRWESDYLHAGDGPENRLHGLELDCTRQIEFHESIRIPSGYRIENVPDPVVIEGKTLEGTYTIKNSGSNRLQIDQTILVKRRLTPADEYPAVRDAVKSLQKIRKTILVLEPDGKLKKNPPQPMTSSIPVENTTQALDFGARIHAKDLDITLADNRLIERFRTDVTIFNERGRDDFADSSYVIDQRNQTIQCLESYVILPDGTRIDSPQTAINLTMSSEAVDAPDYADIKNFVVSHVGVEYGSRLVSTVERITNISPEQRSYLPDFLFLPGVDYAADEVTFSVSVPPGDSILYEAFNTSSTPVIQSDDAGRTAYTWTFTDLAPNPYEWDSGGYFRNEPFIMAVIGSVPDWTTRANLLRSAFFHSLPVNESVKSKVDKLLKNTETDDEKIEAICNFVANTIMGIELSPQRIMFVTRPPERVLNTGYGYSWDKISLLTAMIESAGGHCSIGLAGPRWCVSDNIPVIRTMGDLFIRLMLGRSECLATIDNQPVSPSDLIDKTILWISRDNSDWTKTDPHSDGMGENEMNLFVDLREDGKISGRIELFWSNGLNPGIEATKNTPHWVKGCLPSWVENPEIVTVDIVTLNPLAGETHILCGFTGTGKFDTFHGGINRMTIPSCPYGLSTDQYRLINSPNRSYPLILKRNGTQHERISIRFPDTYKLIQAPEPVDIPGSYASMKQIVTRDGNNLTIDRLFTLPERIVPSEEYSAFVSTWRIFASETGNRVLFESKQ
ncbi:DUF3857 domain-containing protein [bacterium]|nr:DUF3857 domain-containing protein [candidate division CSSED10-310 bacterium]